VAEEFVINSSAIETKINQLLPSQGGFQPGVDFSASTMVIPIIDLTETAEGSGLRQDLQTSLSHNSVTSFSVVNATTTIISTTGYFRVFGFMSGSDTANTAPDNFSISDGSTDKIILDGRISFGGNDGELPYDFIVFLSAGDSLKAISGATTIGIRGCTRQIADISGNLVNPT
jgi:hypothetical protein